MVCMVNVITKTYCLVSCSYSEVDDLKQKGNRLKLWFWSLLLTINRTYICRPSLRCNLKPDYALDTEAVHGMRPSNWVGIWILGWTQLSLSLIVSYTLGTINGVLIFLSDSHSRSRVSGSTELVQSRDIQQGSNERMAHPHELIGHESTSNSKWYLGKNNVARFATPRLMGSAVVSHTWSGFAHRSSTIVPRWLVRSR